MFLEFAWDTKLIWTKLKPEDVNIELGKNGEMFQNQHKIIH